MFETKININPRKHQKNSSHPHMRISPNDLDLRGFFPMFFWPKIGQTNLHKDEDNNYRTNDVMWVEHFKRIDVKNKA